MMMTQKSLIVAFCLVCLNATPFLVTALDDEVIDDYTLEFSQSNLRNQIKQMRQHMRALKESGTSGKNGA
jgi:hypothetical protein